jgi:cytochrome c551/c552
MLRRVGFGRFEIVKAPPAPLSPATRTASYSGTTQPAPKTKPKRNPRLLKLAKGMPCLFMIPDVCKVPNRETTVAAHSNLSIHGKGKARKADDQFSAWICAACHAWLDQGPASADVKTAAFLGAHQRQVIFWRQIAEDDTWPEADRRAARWALDQLKEMKA